MKDQNNELDLNNQEEEIMPVASVPANFFEQLSGIDEMESTGVDMVGEYWQATDEDINIPQRFCYVGCQEMPYPSFDGSGPRMVNTVKLLKSNGDGTATLFYQGSKRLVSIFQDGKVPEGTFFEITFLGKRKNKTNNFSSDHWKAIQLKSRTVITGKIFN